MRILVTGATGYGGSRLVAAALRTGLDTLINPAPKPSPA
jgi:uncharacterized protein YbjT (DUF2867 family)